MEITYADLSCIQTDLEYSFQTNEMMLNFKRKELKNDFLPEKDISRIKSEISEHENLSNELSKRIGFVSKIKIQKQEEILKYLLNNQNHGKKPNS